MIDNLVSVGGSNRLGSSEGSEIPVSCFII
jgi:hypothetical protein